MNEQKMRKMDNLWEQVGNECLIDEKILINPKTGCEYIDVPPTIAAKYLGVALNFIYEGLKQQILPIGVAVQSDKGRWTYNIPVERLKKYKDGVDMNVTTTLLNNILPLLQQTSRRS